jgi:hypothetical protein
MSYTPLRTPFLNMSFTPDVPSNALGLNEYNSGRNVDPDFRAYIDWVEAGNQPTILETSNDS